MAENSTQTTNYDKQEAKEKVIKGSAKVEKKKFSKKIIDFLFSDKIDSMGNYLAYSILGPSLKNLIFQLGNGMLSMALFGGGSIAPGGSGTYIPGYGYQTARREPVPYSNMANPNYAQPQVMGYAPQRVGMNDISFDSRDDCYLVLDRMNREIARYGKVRVADFYTFAGITGQEGNWTLQANGWYNLNDAHPMMRIDGRWIIEFPPVQPIR